MRESIREVVKVERVDRLLARFDWFDRMDTQAHSASLQDLMDGLSNQVSFLGNSHRRGLRNLLTGIGPVVDMATTAQARVDLVAATRFSVFEYFKENENILSSIFADLMCPAGTHGQGTTFLEHFLRLVDRTSGTKNIRPRQAYGDLRGFEVYKEYAIDHGRRIDIVLRESGRWIGIENKPWASEQDDQLGDYLAYLQRLDCRSCVLYLNGKGEEANTIPPERAESYLMVPYKDRGSGRSVSSWIEDCLKSCRADNVRWFLRDLRDYIDREFEDSIISMQERTDG